jgi:Tfp pilus assembly protein PilO
MIQVVVQTPLPTPPSPPPDPNLLAMHAFELLTIIVLAVATIFIVRWVVMSPIGQAIGERLRGKRHALVTGEQEDRLARIEAEMQALRGDLSEISERLDFTERVLAERRERRLGAGS